MNQETLPVDQVPRDALDLAARKLSGLRIPLSTYRLQLNHRFRFKDAGAVIPYLYELGITDCYTSPYFLARAGSLHGYDILDHHRLNPEIGTDKEYDEFTEEIRRHGMGQLLDIVPNHMSISGRENLWWMDVLENGPSSVYADFFDIDWKPVKAVLENKVLLPILGEQYGRVLENQELKLIFEEGAFAVLYYDLKLPLNPSTYIHILKYRIDHLETEMGKEHVHFQEFLSIITALNHLPSSTEKDPEKRLERRREKEIIKKRLAHLINDSQGIRAFLAENLQTFNGVPGEPRSFDMLDQLLSHQAFRLSHWRVATDEINYRRFFDINELAAIRVENLQVFRETHELILKLVGEKKVTGLRVDHPDGLYNPVEYLYRLQKACFVQICLSEMSSPETPDTVKELAQMYDEALSQDGSSPLRLPFYIVGEKILTKGEKVPEDWPIFGTTGYSFLNLLNGIFIDPRYARAMDQVYARFVKENPDYQTRVCENKKLIMRTAMASEIHTLGHYLDRLSEKDRHTRDFTLNDLTTVIVEVIANFPVYRTYANQCGINERDKRYMEQAVAKARKKNPVLSSTLFDFLENILLLRFPDDIKENDRSEWLDFVMRFQQLTGPIMAKGVEDTTFYTYNRFVSLNEVGGSPDRFGTPLETFHGQLLEKGKISPHSLNATSTHDTKRGEDVRARLNVLSELSEEWRKCVFRWSRTNKRKKASVDGQWVPGRNEEYLIYQTLVGTWPNLPMDRNVFEDFKMRLKNYLVKAVREAKVNTSWISPNDAYEAGLLKFIDSLLEENDLFRADFETFQKKVAYLGMFNSLSQTLLKITSPGIPDFYQGTEIWDFSLVDPDNRHPVDFSLRKAMLQELKANLASARSDLPAFHRGLLRNWRDGSAKLYVTFMGLQYRKENRELFMSGLYIPLAVEGNRKDHLCAFARQQGEGVCLVCVPRAMAHLLQNTDDSPLPFHIWGDTAVTIPKDIGGGLFRNYFTGKEVSVFQRDGGEGLFLRDIFADFPVALLQRTKE